MKEQGIPCSFSDINKCPHFIVCPKGNILVVASFQSTMIMGSETYTLTRQMVWPNQPTHIMLFHNLTKLSSQLDQVVRTT